MQEVLILTYCDNCFQSEDAGRVKTEATVTAEVRVGDEEARLDLCERCDQELLAPLRGLISTRAAAQRVLDRAAAADGGTDTDGTGRSRSRSERPNITARCSICESSVHLRNRGQHARDRHQTEPQDITWTFGPEVTELWTCSCGLPFPTEHGRTTHAHRAGHPLPESEKPDSDTLDSDTLGSDTPPDTPEAESERPGATQQTLDAESLHSTTA
jgi:hypothetical protein